MNRSTEFNNPTEPHFYSTDINIPVIARPSDYKQVAVRADGVQDSDVKSYDKLITVTGRLFFYVEVINNYTYVEIAEQDNDLYMTFSSDNESFMVVTPTPNHKRDKPHTILRFDGEHLPKISVTMDSLYRSEFGTKYDVVIHIPK
jgi:hypothetical protein